MGAASPFAYGWNVLASAALAIGSYYAVALTAGVVLDGVFLGNPSWRVIRTWIILVLLMGGLTLLAYYVTIRRIMSKRQAIIVVAAGAGTMIAFMLR